MRNAHHERKVDQISAVSDRVVNNTLFDSNQTI